MVEYVSLGILMQGKMSGYDIKKISEQSVSLFFKMSYGSLYPALKRLVEAGHLIEEETNDSKNKKLYAITDQGRNSFLGWLREPLQSNRREHLLKIFFYDYLEEETRMRNLKAFQLQLQSGIAQMEAVQAMVSKELEQLPNKEEFYYRVSVMHYGLQFFKMEHEFFSKIIEKGDL
ncbi:PadR family transcriptional regulator [Paenibacillus sp. NEAU-GSW1]|uniref:PadR family transcriptional regulator n=1 Tax=Paenibacillus sp. NEAU-GSW1 TaxID=2682486 RepID=UPI0012E16A0B|nr:PadR family transcriptional regulator [Paenibacillus sp. NEAU-GSW1]MUT65715.1 PadR family transcriptional regulator [Paenibacillus sp. NEAU-GSW1]